MGWSRAVDALRLRGIAAVIRSIFFFFNTTGPTPGQASCSHILSLLWSPLQRFSFSVHFLFICVCVQNVALPGVLCVLFLPGEYSIMSALWQSADTTKASLQPSKTKLSNSRRDGIET